jgi:ABC-type lipoprotein release transport system permease subunit
VFVALRVLRAVRNEGTNTGPLFIASAIVLGVMWLIYAVRLLLAM